MQAESFPAAAARRAERRGGAAHGGIEGVSGVEGVSGIAGVSGAAGVRGVAGLSRVGGFSRETVQSRLVEFLNAKAVQLAGISPDLAEALAAATDLLAGGKRLRPAFLYWGWRAAGGPPADESAVLTAAAAMELLQASALIHDDVMDGSEVRRGLPAAHRRFAAIHRSAGWTGSPEDFGTGAAILLGDLCLSWSDEMLRCCGLPADRLLRRWRTSTTCVPR